MKERKMQDLKFMTTCQEWKMEYLKVRNQKTVALEMNVKMQDMKLHDML